MDIDMLALIKEFGPAIGLLIYLLKGLIPRIDALKIQQEIHKLEISRLTEKIKNMEDK